MHKPRRGQVNIEISIFMYLPYLIVKYAYFQLRYCILFVKKAYFMMFAHFFRAFPYFFFIFLHFCFISLTQNIRKTLGNTQTPKGASEY